MKWVSTFSYLSVKAVGPQREIDGETQWVVFDNNLNGNKMRIRFSNRHSEHLLILDSVMVGILRDGQGQLEGCCPVALRGNGQIRLLPGEECYSDEIALPVSAGCRIAVLCVTKEAQKIGSICSMWSRKGAKAFHNAGHELTDGCALLEKMEEEEKPGEIPSEDMFFYGFSGVQVWTADEVKVIAAFGDSITHMSCVTNALYERLCRDYPGKAVLLNRGIGGNRVLRDGAYIEEIPGNGSNFGKAGIRRFEEDVFGDEAVDAVILHEGINDIMHPAQFGLTQDHVTPEELVQGYREAADIVHRHGAKIFGATVTPCGNKEYPDSWMEEFEGIREGVNAAIREGQPGYDGFFDYDRAVRKEECPSYMKEEYHIGDGLHPNDAGGRAMAEVVDLEGVMGLLFYG